MLLPDVTAIINDPEVGGGVGFQVIRYSSVRKRGGYKKTPETYEATGNIQPHEMGNQASTTEDLLNESIVIYSTYAFQAGSNDGTSIVEADIVYFNDLYWRVTRVEDWSKWGISKAYATRMRDKIILPDTEDDEQSTEQTTEPEE